MIGAMSLSVCFLTRNEPLAIVRAIGSVKGVADQIIVGDMGSNDHTPRAASDAGATVVPVKWAEDFSAARHALLEHCTGDWILWMNASEQLLPEAIEPLRACQQRSDVAAFFVRIRNIFDRNRADQWMETGAIRLWKRRPDLLFQGRLHPHLAPAFQQAIERDGLKVDGSEIVLSNDDPGYAGKWDEPKLRFTARLLERELQDRPRQLHYIIEYGRTLLELNDRNGHTVLADAAQQVRQVMKQPTAPAGKVQVLLEYLMRGPDDAPALAIISRDEALRLASRWFASSPPLLYMVAEHCFRTGDYGQAASVLERLIRLGQSRMYDRSSHFDPALVGEDAIINLAACYRRLARLDEAERCYRQLLGSPKYAKAAAEGLAAIAAERGGG
jgi:glycosyltransferase involved in cell wall biosynthesis